MIPYNRWFASGQSFIPMIHLSIEMLTGEYEAKPYYHSVFSGTLEIPPNPTRIFRAICSGMFRVLRDDLYQQGNYHDFQLRTKQVEKKKGKKTILVTVPDNATDKDGDIPIPEEWKSLLLKLSSTLPSFYIPPYTLGNRAKYTPKLKPTVNFSKPSDDVLNQNRLQRATYAQFDPDNQTFFLQYDINLTKDEKAKLQSAVDAIAYFGRSESLCEWNVIDKLPKDKIINCYPDENGLITSYGFNTDCPNRLEALTSSTKEDRMNGRSHNPAMTPVNYTLVPERHKIQRRVSNREVQTLVFNFSAPTPVDTYDGLEWTDRLHKALVKELPTSEKFTGHRDGEAIPESEGCWYFWEATDNGRITQLKVCSPTPFTREELIAAKALTKLYSSEMTINLRLLDMRGEYQQPSTHFRSVTPVLLYTGPREGKVHRSAQAQVLNTVYWALSGNRDKLEEYQVDDATNAVSATIPGIGLVTARVTGVVESVVTQRGGRQSPYPKGFEVEVETEIPVSIPCVGFNRRFGAGRLVVA